MDERLELLAAVLAAVGIFFAIVMPPVVLVPSTAIVGTGLAARLLACSHRRERAG